MPKELSGRVTALNADLLSFQIGDNTTVHMALFLATNPQGKLPQIGNLVTVENVHKFPNANFVLDASSRISGPTCHQLITSPLVKLLEKVAPETWMAAVNVYNVLKTKFEYKNELFISLLKRVLRLEKFKVFSISDCVYVDKLTKNYSDFPLWSFGIHSKPSTECLLVGYIEVLNKYGHFLLKDEQYQMVCVVYNHEENSEGLYNLMDKFVLIRNYKIVTEIFGKNSTEPNFDCLLVDFTDIEVIFSGESTTSKLFVTAGFSRNPSGYNTLCFELKRKSMPIIGDSKKPEIWFEIGVGSERKFLILPMSFLKVYHCFFVGQHYTLYHQEPLEKLVTLPLTLLNPHIKQFVINEATAFFSTIEAPKPPPELLSVVDCKHYVKSNTNLVSFEGVITTKKLSKPLPSKTSKICRIYGYGTPALMTPCLTFIVGEKSNKVFLDFYLNNWENILNPIGLIPNMRVAVRNVLPANKKYVKSCCLTTIEVLGYEPSIHFETSNLHYLTDDLLDWGQQFYFSLGNRIPFGVLVWARIISLQVTSAKICIRCKRCERLSECIGACLQCSGLEKTSDITVLIKAMDDLGTSKILLKNLDDLMVLFNLSQRGAKGSLEKALERLGRYEFKAFESKLRGQAQNGRDHLTSVLDNLFLHINAFDFSEFHAKCRKQQADIASNKGLSFWFCVELRRAS